MAEEAPMPTQQYKPEMRKISHGELVAPNRRTNGAGVQAEHTRICVVMVGLPARGKSLIASKGQEQQEVQYEDSN